MLARAGRVLRRLRQSRAGAVQPAPTSTEESAVRGFLERMADRDEYLQLHPDVAAAKLDAIDHWLRHGLGEGREFPGFKVRRGATVLQATGREWQRFSWCGEPLAIGIAPLRRVSPRVVEQIMAQARHDTAVLAPGALALPKLRIFDATDLMDRDGIDLGTVLASVREAPAAMLVIPYLLMGGGEKYAADLVDALAAGGVGPILVLVTEQTEKEAAGWGDLAILAPIRRANIVFWRDVCGSFGSSNPTTLARFVNALRPRLLVVVNSRLGLEAVARFGRGMSQFARLACAFFSMGVNAIGAPYGARFPRRIMPFALALTDNQPMAETLRRLHGEIPGPGIAIVPPRIEPAADDVFGARLAARLAGKPAAGPGRRWAWVSRIEPFKGTALLAALAKARPADRFDVFGVAQAGTDAAGLDLPNIELRPALPNVSAADFSQHDGFLFTSLFEGMPNIVLEMSQQAIPMVIADVGGLRQTFDDSAILFARHGAGAEESVPAFSRALDQVAGMGTEEVVRMVTAAREQAIARHAPDAHARSVATALGLPQLAPCP